MTKGVCSTYTLSEIRTFDYFGRPIRGVICERGELIAIDVCQALGILNTPQALRPLDDDEKGWAYVLTAGGVQRVRTLTEPGFSTLMLRCRNALKRGTPEYAFRRKVVHEILPQIRKTGAYSPLPEPEPVTEPELEVMPERSAWDVALRIAQALLRLEACRKGLDPEVSLALELMAFAIGSGPEDEKMMSGVMKLQQRMRGVAA